MAIKYINEQDSPNANDVRDAHDLYVDGDLGVGTTEPGVKLEINGSIRGNQQSGSLRIETENDLYLDIGPRNSSFSHFYTNSDEFYFSKGICVNGGEIRSYDEDLILKTATTPRMKILNSNGNVGVGTTDPGKLLTLESSSNTVADDILRLQLAAGHVAEGYRIGSIEFYAQDPSDGGTGITSEIRSYADIDFVGTGGNQRNSNLGFFVTKGTTSNERMTIKSDGKVGIGTTEPDEKLHVNGKVKIGNWTIEG